VFSVQRNKEHWQGMGKPGTDNGISHEFRHKPAST
jgi:hypothetical protein